MKMDLEAALVMEMDLALETAPALATAKGMDPVTVQDLPPAMVMETVPDLATAKGVMVELKEVAALVLDLVPALDLSASTSALWKPPPCSTSSSPLNSRVRLNLKNNIN